MDLNIVNINPETKIVSFRFNRVPRRTRGIEDLLQLAAKTILTTPGQDIWSPEYGGGLLSYTAQANAYNKSVVESDIASIIKKSEEQILKEQQDKYVAPDSKLKRLDLLGIEWLSDKTSIIIRVLVTAESGVYADIRLPNQLTYDAADEEPEITAASNTIYNNKNEAEE